MQYARGRGRYELVTLEFNLVSDRNFNRVEITVDG